MAASVTLQQLGLTAAEGRNPAITGIAVDSREVQAGFLFAALPGSQVHGGEFHSIRFADGRGRDPHRCGRCRNRSG